MPPTPEFFRSAGARLGRDGYYAVLFALAYLGGSELAYALSLGPSVGGTFWPPSGISLGVLLVAPIRRWPTLLLAGVLANYASDFLHGQTLWASIGFAAANLGEPLIGALLLRRLLPGPIVFTRLQEMVAVGLVAVFVSTPLAAVLGAVTAQWYTQNPPALIVGWRTWWVGDAVGALVLTPLVVRVMVGWRQWTTIAGGTWLEAAAFGITVWAVTDAVFSGSPASTAMPFLVFPVLLWGSIRLGLVAVGAALCLIVVLTAHDTASGLGPFAAEHLSLGDRLVALQTFVGVMALSFHTLGLIWEERTRTAAALKLAHSGLEARHRRIVEQSPLAIVSVKADGRVEDANPAWQRLQVPSSEGPTTARRWHDDALAPLVRRAFLGEIVELPERTVAHHQVDRAPRRVRGFAFPVKDDSGAVAEVVLIERDITDETLAREQLLAVNQALREREDALSRALQQMAEAQAHRELLLNAERSARAEVERASRLKDEFLATLSHELRTPLNAIVGWAHILRRSPGSHEQAVETIDRNATALAKLIDDLLDMSRIVAGKVGLTTAPVKLADIVVAATSALRPAALAKDMTLRIDVDEVRHLCVNGDAARLQQVVNNLVDNGIKFTPAGGQVTVRVSAGATGAELVVHDTGSGIDPELLPTIFERFRQADGSTTRRHSGLGLGLSIAKQIVEMHGGAITARSDGDGGGATFIVTLPTLQEHPAVVAAPVTGWKPGALSSLRILVVDDHADARELLHRLLVEQGCEVACAASAEEALQHLRTSGCDVLLTDIGMPETDGYELVRRVRAIRANPPRTVAVTAFARPEDRDRAYAAGFDAHLPKPVDPAHLLHILARLSGPPPPATGDARPGATSDAAS